MSAKIKTVGFFSIDKCTLNFKTFVYQEMPLKEKSHLEKISATPKTNKRLIFRTCFSKLVKIKKKRQPNRKGDKI